ncbi:MAG: aminotransferase class I/II-fold pyridoxal phosphate-dependent enzyme [Caldilineae bacterium]|nr:MAG: aminotransferase class I/II-fold pyridoxal phosphate-dependent enzyme [Caldilineae bacterium]
MSNNQQSSVIKPKEPLFDGDIFAKAYKFTIAREAMAAGYYPYFRPLEGNEGATAIYQGRRVLMCGSNNYLGLTTHPKVREAAIKAIEQYGTSCTGSRFLNGTLEMHLELERELADWVGKEAALVFSTGMQVNLGVISALVGRQDYVILDKEDHASIVDGALLSMGKIKRFKHNDMADLERVLSKLEPDAGKLVVVDGLYSMEGDIAPLPELVPLCKKYGARLMVDDAHAMGVLGGGRGTAAHFGLTDEVDLIMSTFSKSFASLGGFIAGDDQVIHYIQHHARSLIFSASIPPANAAAALAALHVMQEEPELIERVNKNGEKMRKGLREMGFDIGNSTTPVVPIIIGDDMRTVMAWWRLLENGVFVNAVLAPGVAQGRQLLRTSYMATHTDEQLDEALEVFGRVGKELGLI